MHAPTPIPSSKPEVKTPQGVSPVIQNYSKSYDIQQQQQQLQLTALWRKAYGVRSTVYSVRRTVYIHCTRGGYTSILVAYIVPYLYNSNEPGTNVAHVVEAPTPLADR